jgi:hypothetical protein
LLPISVLPSGFIDRHTKPIEIPDVLSAISWEEKGPPSQQLHNWSCLHCSFNMSYFTVCGKISRVVKDSCPSLFQSEPKTADRGTKHFKSQEDQQQIQFLDICRKYSSKSKLTRGTYETTNASELAKWENEVSNMEKEGHRLMESAKKEEGITWIGQVGPLL